MTSPMEAAIDRATGFDRAAFKRKQEEENERAVAALLDSADAVKAWWLSKRPSGWRKARHLRNPHVNCTTAEEKQLADGAVALIISRL